MSEATHIATQVNAYVAPGCDENYSGACVPVNEIDVDCEGTGDGPAWVSGPIQVNAWDHYALDADGDGVACDDRTTTTTTTDHDGSDHHHHDDDHDTVPTTTTTTTTTTVPTTTTTTTPPPSVGHRSDSPDHRSGSMLTRRIWRRS